MSYSVLVTCPLMATHDKIVFITSLNGTSNSVSSDFVS